MSYAVWGEKCVEHLNGMFALAVWDEREKTLFLARDRMGQKPLYVCESDEGFAFASEVSALRILSWVDLSIWPEGLGSYLQYGCTDRFFKGCYQQPPGFTRMQRAGTPGHQRKYFEPAGSEQAHSADGDVRSLVVDAVARQLVSDVPLGVFLSGGIDSSVIAVAARLQGEIDTFSIGFDDPRYDESAYARQVAEHLQTRHHEFHVTPAAAEDLPALARAFGEPFADSSALPTHYLSRQTRSLVKVALSGDGGDELFGGYERYQAVHLSRWLWPLRVFAPIGRRLMNGHPKATAARAGRFLRSLALPLDLRYDSYLRIFDDATIAALLPGEALQESRGDAHVAVIYRTMRQRTGSAVCAAAATDRITYLPDDLLTKVDRCSMMHGLEVRSPFMDHELVQFAASLRADQLLQGGPKRMLREAFARDLPAWVFKRKKMGFALPIGEWFRSDAPLKAMLHDNLFSRDAFGAAHFSMNVVSRLVNEHMQHKADHSQRLYALLMLELWWRTRKN
jgi:asparagine synthase (glutamine-hydrolysing)